MTYRITLVLQSGDTTGVNPIIDVKWNGNIMVGSHEITKKYDSTYNDFYNNTDRLNFYVDNLSGEDSLEVVYKNPTQSSEIKIWFSGLEINSGPSDPDYNPSLPLSSSNQEFMWINKNDCFINSITIDGVDTTIKPADGSSFPGIAIMSSGFELKIKTPFTVISSSTSLIKDTWDRFDSRIENYEITNSKVLVN